MVHSVYHTPTATAKRRKFFEQKFLLPGLPDHLAEVCLSFVNPSILYPVCRSWRRLIYTPFFPPFLSLYAVLSSPSQPDPDRSISIKLFTFDPISYKWHILPPPPLDPPLRLLLRHPSFLSRNLPIQSVSVAGKLILVAATTDNLHPALSRPLIFNPVAGEWTFGPPLGVPRRWCSAGASREAVYVASGIGSHYRSDVARSVEKWDLREETWEKMSALKDGRFSRDAIDAVGWRGKLCMVNVKGDAAKEGIIYDVEKDSWEEMPEGMIAGWRGPVAAMDEDVMYVVDEAKGALRKFHPERDEWEEIMESEKLRRAEHIAAGGGRVCVVCGGGGGSEIAVVDVVASTPRLWMVNTPPGFQATAVHILPRMSLPEVGGFPVLAPTSTE